MQVETVLGDYTEWKERNEYFSLLDYVTINCSIEQIALSSILFFPEINFVEGFAFAKQSKQNEFALQYIEQHDDRKAIERYVNCFFLESFFPPKNKKEKNMIVYVIQLLSDIWKMFFERKYPDTVFSIEAFEDELDGWCITFYQNDTPQTPFDKKQLADYFTQFR